MRYLRYFSEWRESILQLLRLDFGAQIAHKDVKLFCNE